MAELTSMNRKDLVNLLLKEIREMSLLCESLSEVDEIPPALLHLCESKVGSMDEILTNLKQSAAPETEVKPTVPKPASQAPTNEPKSPVAQESPQAEVAVEEPTQAEVAPNAVTELESVAPDTTTTVEEAKPQTEPQPVEVQPIKAEVGKTDGKTATKPETSQTEEKPSGKEAKQESPALTEKKTEENGNARKKPGFTTIERRFVKSLKLSVGDRYRFGKELFGGNMQLLTQTMEELDTLGSYEAAAAYVEQFHWDEENEAAIDFHTLLMSRFS